MTKVTTVIVDVEARGASPFRGEMTEFGAVALNENLTAVRDTFHGVLIEATPDPENPAIPYYTEASKRYSESEVMEAFQKWLQSLGGRVVFLSDNPLYDGMWIWYYFDKAGVRNPFGHSGRRIGDFAAGLSKNWSNTSKWKKLRVTKHTHNPVDDAMGNAEAMIELIAMSRGEKPIKF